VDAVKRKAKRPESYVSRTYRASIESGKLVTSLVQVKDTDLHILADYDVVDAATALVLKYRLQIERYIDRYPGFAKTLAPLPQDRLAPAIVRAMLNAGLLADVGPMAAVAGSIAEFVGRDLLAGGCTEVVVENGGDVFCARRSDTTVAIFAGSSPLSLKVGVRLAAQAMPVAICSSSGTVGHSLSFGKADSATVISADTSLADAVATRLGNEAGAGKDIEGGINRALAVGRAIPGVAGIVIIRGDKIGAVGDVELVGL